MPITLQSSATTVRAGEVFRIMALVGANSTAPVDAAQVYLDFNAEVFEVISLAGGSRLEYQLQASVDNDAGRVGFAAGTLEGAVTYRFTLCTLTLRAKETTTAQSSLIEFARLQKPRQTKAVKGGLNVTGNLASIRVIVR